VKQPHVVHLAPLTTRILPHTSHLYTQCHTAPRIAVVLLLRVRLMNDVTIAGLVASCFILSVYGCRPANQDALPLMLSWCSPGQRSNVSSPSSSSTRPERAAPTVSCWRRMFHYDTLCPHTASGFVLSPSKDGLSSSLLLPFYFFFLRLLPLASSYWKLM
jgi:hypothetical protein